MQKSGSREEYEEWKTQKLRHLDGMNTGDGTTQQGEEEGAPQDRIYRVGGGEAVAGGVNRWMKRPVVLVIVGAIATFVLVGCGKSKAPTAAVTPDPQHTAPGSSYMESVDRARQAYEEHVASVEDAIKDYETGKDSSIDDTGMLILDNQTDMEVFVKVVGDGGVTRTVNVPPQTTVEKRCPTGNSFLKMRYRTGKGYEFQKGDGFTISRQSTTTITLHKVVAGNYGSSTMNPAEF